MKKVYTKNMKKKILLKYNTPISVIESEQKIMLGVKPDTKLGDYFKKVGFPSLAEMMKS